jgi:hypothetical protein
MYLLRSLCPEVLTTVVLCSLLVGCAAPGAPAPLPPTPPGQLPAQLPAGMGGCWTRHFLIVSDDQAWANELGGILEQAAESFRRSYGANGFDVPAPRDSLTWLCFSSPAQYDQYTHHADGNALSYLDSFYSAGSNQVVLVRPEGRPLATTQPVSRLRMGEVVRATHELAHQLAFNCGLMKRGVMYPLWVSEGLATNFEADDRGHWGPDSCNRQRIDALAGALRRGRLLSLGDLAALTRPGQGAIGREQYAQAWALWRFMMERHREKLKAYLATLAQLPPGRRDDATLRCEFLEAFGPLAPLEAQWQQYAQQVAGLQ